MSDPEPVTYNLEPADRRITIRELPPCEWPENRLQDAGLSHLSDVELLALFINTADAIQAARACLQAAGGELRRLPAMTPQFIASIAHVGQGEAVRLGAVIELGRRLYSRPTREPYTVCSPATAAQYFIPKIANLPQEELHVMSLDNRNKVIETRMIYRGSINLAGGIRPADILKPVVILAARAFILCHNHPSGDPSPSPEDADVTLAVLKSAEVMGIKFLDHIIVAANSFTSLAESRLGGLGAF